MMTESRIVKVMLCVDGSERSLETVRQFGRWQETVSEAHIVLWHVFNQVPGYCWDLEKEPGAGQAAVAMRAWEHENRKQADAFMDRSRQVLMQSGFGPERIKTVIRPREKGVARDIIAEARQDYDLVVLRRRGASALSGLIMGSVANKLVERIDFTTLMIVGMAPPLRQVLVGIDGSEGSLRAARFAGRLALQDAFALTLAGVQRQAPAGEQSFGFEQLSAALEKIRRELVDRGVPEGRIHVRVLSASDSRAASLAEVAEKDELDTVVVGRRGWSSPEDFAIGGVARKVIELARYKTVFVVN
jgi:nucleotide-binding universal stress UspA family protein